jgi:hypothetical protein
MHDGISANLPEKKQRQAGSSLFGQGISPDLALSQTILLDTKSACNGLKCGLDLLRCCIWVSVDPCTLLDLVALVDAHNALQTR